MTQYVVRFRLGNTVVKERTVRLQRALDAGWPRELHFDMRPPKVDVDNISITFLYYGTTANLLLDNARVEAFED